MKNQYVADVNDYNKYLLLTDISNIYDTIDICWMLTPDDGKRDGRKTNYLFDGSKRQDTLIYDCLRGLVTSGIRDIKAIQKAGIIPIRKYYPNLEDIDEEDLPDLLFFDPDNGLEIKSVHRNSPQSKRYVYYSDIEPILEQDCDVLVYQHYPRVNHGEYHLHRTQEIKERLGNVRVQHIPMGMVDFILIQNNPTTTKGWDCWGNEVKDIEL